MLKELTIISNKLLYFAEIGEFYKVNAENVEELIGKLNKTRTRRRFKVSHNLEGGYSIIWRTK